MLRRWGIPLAMLALATGPALATSSASAATMGFSPGGPIHLVGASSNLRGGISHQAESTNWSGYAATTGTYTSVSASWTQPAGSCRRGDQYAAFWVGLDGYTSSSVEQTGSEVDCVGRTAEYYAWYEMYPGPSENYSNTVRAGDHFNASVTYESNNKFSLFIADTTRGWSHTTTASLAGAARSSAEVIVEAPCCTANGGILPLTDFKTVSLTSSMANGSALGNAGGVTQIIMIDNAGRDKDTVSTLSGGENFSATWLRSS
ncbi:MAG: G1 family glutamic endopeptidase [Streptosporangiaceae bacterium]